MAEAFGFHQAKIDAIGCSSQEVREGKGPWTERDRVILRLVDEQLASYDNEPETVKEALKLLSVEELVESLIIIGIYALMARVVNGLKVDDDEITNLKKLRTAITD